MLNPNPKPSTFPYKIKWLIIHYATGSVDDETFKTSLRSYLASFPMSTESASVCIAKYLLEQEKYGPLTVDDLKHIAGLISEVDSWLGSSIQSWIEETYS